MSPVVVQVFHKIIKQIAIAQKLFRAGNEPGDQLDINFEDVSQGLRQLIHLFLPNHMVFKDANEVGVAVVQVGYAAAQDLQEQLAGQ